ncbi:MAG: threonine--tRNA ligase [Microgenomates group bacterium]
MQKDNLDNLRHSAAHLLAAAVMELWPNTKRTIGPAIENGFYFDFEFEQPVSENDFAKIEQKMHELVKKWESFECTELSPDDAKKEYINNPYKHELIDEFSQNGETLTFYKSGDYWDLCKGGHCEHPSQELKYFKLLSVAGAYWRGSEKNKMLTRIYGTIFPTKEELDAHLTLLEEAKKRDHRKIGAEQQLFFIDDVVGKGLVMWLPNGTIIRDQIEKLAIQMEEKDGYVRVVTPHIAKEELFLTSGHLPYYKEDMFPPMIMDDGTYYLKAMNCPHHHRIYLHTPKSYRELPLRLAEYGTVYRNEMSGTLAGLLRVRALAMNDAHIYLRKDQVKEEFKKVLKLTTEYFNMFGLKDYWFRLSKWDKAHKEKYIDEPENWEYTEQVIREVLQEEKYQFEEVADEAAFYGPKVDVQFKSIIGREETMSTIQLDFAAKSRFNLTYTDETGAENNEVFVIHRAPLSTHERFMAFLIEHYAGAFPFWLAPVQVSILPVSDKFADYAQEIANDLKTHGVRVFVDSDNKTLGAKIRQTTLQKVPFMCIIGEKEVEAKNVSVRTREGQDLGVMSLAEFANKLSNHIENKQ